jgi:hypothetical protein
MGFLNKLFGSDNSNNLTKTSEMLDENLYWQIVQESLKNSGTQDGQQEYLVRRLQKLNPKDIVGFRLRTDKLLHDTYNSEMWCAGYIMNGGCSDDSFEYFRNWVISRGKDVYYSAKQNPDTLIEQVDEDAEFYDFEDFWYVALGAFKNKTGKDLYDFIDDDNFKFKEGHYPNFDFTWQEENPESMKAICPNLFDRMWK